jgi:hypothetical protein
MAQLQPRYSMEEFARRGDEIYDRDIHPNITASDDGKFVLIDIESGDYEIDADEIAASDRLLARHPDAQVWMLRVGSRYARQFGRPSTYRFGSRCKRTSS